MTETTDNSGVRIFYTPKIRQFDAATLAVGHTVTPLQIVPPNQDWTTVGHCHPKCTDDVTFSFFV